LISTAGDERNVKIHFEKIWLSMMMNPLVLYLGLGVSTGQGKDYPEHKTSAERHLDFLGSPEIER
jgi:hypothetical protein